MTNLPNQTETKKEVLTINTTVQVHDTVELQLELPYFCKTADNYYFKVIDQESAIRVYTKEFLYSTPVSLIMSGTTSVWYPEIAKATQVSEVEFILALSNAITYLQKLAA